MNPLIQGFAVQGFAIKLYTENKFYVYPKTLLYIFSPLNAFSKRNDFLNMSLTKRKLNMQDCYNTNAELVPNPFTIIKRHIYPETIFNVE